jgi:hypothetical protein
VRGGAGGAPGGRPPPAALETLPAMAAASAAGRLSLDVSAAGRPWRGGDGTAKRTLIDNRTQETR